MSTNEASHGTAIRIRGLVQGVGFRPTVLRLASARGFEGDVCNDSDGVLIRLAGGLEAAGQLVADIKVHCPALARIDEVEFQPTYLPDTMHPFKIAPSREGSMRTEIAPDAATCPDCLAEIRDPSARRFRYPFTNCTHCGPRLSIICDAPYDRARTTMAQFALCPDCRAEYENPYNRRFHAQPIACPICGPHVSIEVAGHARHVVEESKDAIAVAAQRLLAGDIVAIKGLGGYQLACDATNVEVVLRLRRGKARDAKPFALMARDLSVIERYAHVGAAERLALTNVAAPIVLLDSAGKHELPESIAPGLSRFGFMLPSTPLHHLLFETIDVPLIMTSGNHSGEPQIIDDEAARAGLDGIADFFVVHDRAIAMRLDDSVVQIAAGEPRLLRRARGFAPAPIRLSSVFRHARSLVGMGSELKNSFCFLRGNEAILSPHIGDLEDAECLRDLEENLALYRHLFDHRPQAVAVDLHPDYLSTKLGREFARREGLPVVAVQHHHAHVASVMAEHHLDDDQGQVLGLVLDGLGFGDDGTFWGGEILLCTYRDYQKLGCLKPVGLPGGASAMREPWRNTLAHILAAMDWTRFEQRFVRLPFYEFLQAKPLKPVMTMIEHGLNTPMASSCGRLFDAVAAAVGICPDRVSYEGEAAMRLEALVTRECFAALEEEDAYPFAILREAASAPLLIDPAPMWTELFGNLRDNVDTALISARFHKGLVQVLGNAVQRLRYEDPNDIPRRIVLSGGVMQNRLLCEALVSRLEGDGFAVYLPSQVPSNDGGLSLGQAAIAAARMKAG